MLSIYNNEIKLRFGYVWYVEQGSYYYFVLENIKGSLKKGFLCLDYIVEKFLENLIYISSE